MNPFLPPDTAAATDESVDPLTGQPIRRVLRDGTEFVLLGTAHVSPASVAAVEALIAGEAFDAVAVELCPSRAQAMRDPLAFSRMDLFDVVRQGKVGMVAASLVLSSYQQRLARQYGIEPGAEMKAAMHGADSRDVPVWLVDREVGTTLRRAWRNVGFWARFGLLGSLLASVFERADVSEEEIEQLKEGDLLESAFGDFARTSPPIYQSLIAERDEFMAARLREEAAGAPTSPRKVLVVVGAGHLKGLARHLAEQVEPPAPRVAELAAVPPPARWPKWLAMGLVLLVFAAIIYAFHRSTALGALAVRDWVLYTGGFAALGALLAGGHPVSIVAAFIAAPIKPFRPGIPAGGISAMAELWRRKPRVEHFESLRDDIGEWKGWWSNRVARTLLNFILVSIGTLIGEYAAGFHILKSLM